MRGKVPYAPNLWLEDSSFINPRVWTNTRTPKKRGHCIPMSSVGRTRIGECLPRLGIRFNSGAENQSTQPGLWLKIEGCLEARSDVQSELRNMPRHHLNTSRLSSIPVRPSRSRSSPTCALKRVRISRARLGKDCMARANSAEVRQRFEYRRLRIPRQGVENGSTRFFDRKS